ncbi:MAG: 50S ribosomal protein L25 [Proteobacteria bacterium]|nr:50S ribosomal protein L25 [Pseudomonadota bacterium]MBU1060609.1 50S ribosomal protein L25 [Pseudomonadota bacterium]
MLQVDMSASKRESFGKGAMRRLRVSGSTPAVLYGNNKEVYSLQLETAPFLKTLFKISRKNAVVSLSINGETHHVLVKEIQTDPVHDTLIHADFYEIDMAETRRFTVPVQLTGKAKGLEFGGELVIHKAAIELDGTPLAIPDVIKADISGLGIGQSLLFSDLDLPAEVTMVGDSSRLCAEVITPAV